MVRRRKATAQKKDTTQAKKIEAGVRAARSGTVNAGEESKTGKKPVGRKPGEPSKNKAFMLPITMGVEIDLVADAKFGGNASALARKVFRDYLDNLKEVG